MERHPDIWPHQGEQWPQRTNWETPHQSENSVVSFSTCVTRVTCLVTWYSWFH